jgi:alginate biosynthesis protein Alg44
MVPDFISLKPKYTNCSLAFFHLNYCCSHSKKENFHMNATPKAQITHESETQRQYPRFSLPSRVVFSGKEYNVKNLSVGGIAVSDVAEAPAGGKQLSLTLKFPFNSFSLGIPLTAEVKHYDAAQKILSCQFVNLIPEQVSFLNHAVKSYVSGDIVSAENVLNIVQRNNFTKARKPANSNTSSSFRRQLPGLLAVLAIGGVMAALILGNLYNSLFVVHADDATVSAPLLSVRATTEGIFRTKLDAGVALVDENQVIGTITPARGAAVDVVCHCYVAKSTVVTDDAVSSGQEVASLEPVDSKPWVVAEMDPSQAKKIGPDSVANISIFGSRDTFTGHVTSMESSLAGARTGDKATLMKITPDQKLPVDFVNRLAAVTFDVR